MFKDRFDEAKAYYDRREFQAAIQAFTALLDEQPGNADILYALGTSLSAENQQGLAIVILTAANSIRKDRRILFNLGTCYRALRMDKQAEKCWQMCGEMDQTSDLYGNMSGMYLNVHDPEKALALADRGLELDPDDPGCRSNKAIALLELGRWKEGWELYDAALEAGSRAMKQYWGPKLWSGKKGGTLIASGEQGVGDEIMFASMIPDLMKDADKVVIDCHPRLERLFRDSFPDCDVFPHRKNPTETEFAKQYPNPRIVPMGSLGKYYRPTADSFPGTAYLKAKTMDLPGKFKVGIAWKGGTLKTMGAERSMSLDLILPILQVPGVEWYSVEYLETAPKEVCDLEERTGIRIHHWPARVQAFDYAETATFVNSLDLVIAPCTTVVHLCGALGKPCWVLAPHKVAWRYGLEGDRMPMYGSPKVYRQGPDLAWAPVIGQVAEDLKATVAKIPQ